ncbi:uncharacterized protein [Triticum aestivum]|uniref:uncharacterized protein isoform X1 n=1 Tax=Triticum aestivum TaxID=4565 RepID=UPI001D0125F6|nr:uncharacterized protein LOC123066202 isoform X1 [Triticum aestivum]
MELDPHPQAPLLQPLPRPSIPDPRLQVTLSLPQISIRRRPPSTTLTIDEIELLPPSCSPPALCAPSEPTTPCLGFCRTAHRLAGPATTGLAWEQRTTEASGGEAGGALASSRARPVAGAPRRASRSCSISFGDFIFGILPATLVGVGTLATSRNPVRQRVLGTLLPRARHLGSSYPISSHLSPLPMSNLYVVQTMIV